MIGEMQSGAPSVAGVYLTRAVGERNEWWRYFDGRYWSKGIWIGWVARQWYANRTWPLTAKQRETRKMMYFKEYTQD